MSPFGLKLGIEVQVMQPTTWPHPHLISIILEVANPQCSLKFLLYLMLLCSTTEKEFIFTCFFLMSETDNSLL